MQISALKEMLADLKTDERHNNGEEILKREKELAKAYMQEERFWKEKSRVNWLKWGDQNTSSFTPNSKQEIDKIKFGDLRMELVDGA